MLPVEYTPLAEQKILKGNTIKQFAYDVANRAIYSDKAPELGEFRVFLKWFKEKHPDLDMPRYQNVVVIAFRKFKTSY